MEKGKLTRKIISIFLVFLILFSVSWTPISLAIGDMLSSSYYEIDNERKIIGRIEPETPVDAFITKMNVDSSELKVYKDNTCAEEVTTGFVGTGMVLKYDNNIYDISVVGDFDKDGKATQVELTNIIRHIVGLQGAELEGIYYESADLTGDGLVDQRDITKYIRYIVYGELDLGKVDTTPPELTLTTQDVQVNTATVVATAIDREEGMPENPIYTFYLKVAGQPDTSYVEIQSGTNNELNLNNLTSNKQYEVKVVTHDKAGNKAEKTITLTTQSIQGTLNISDETWISGKAQVTISTATNYLIEYQINSNTGTWIQASAGAQTVLVQNLNHNDVVYARLTDGSTQTAEQSKQIKDIKAPEITLNIVNTTSRLEITATAIDNETGIDLSAEYVFYIKEDGGTYVEKQRTTSNTCIIENLSADTNYTIKVEIEDKAGNVGSKEQGTTTQNVPDANQPGNIMFSSATWTGGKASVTISTNTNYTIEYQVNGTADGAWIRGTVGVQTLPVQNLNHNDVIYARLTDGTNAGNYISQTICDSIAPNVTLTLTTDTQKITATANAQDFESGIPTNVTYKFSIKDTGAADSTYVEKQNTTNNVCEFTGLVEGKDYTIKVEVQDVAGNVGIKEESKEIPDNIAPEVTLNVTGKTSNSITAEAGATDVGGMPANPIYVFYIKKTGEPDTNYVQVQSSNNTTCTFTGLATDTDYTIKVTVQDDAGNEGMKEVSCKTDRIPDGTDAGAITFSNITWTSGKATVTISTNTTYTIEYQVNGITGTWTTGTIVNNLNHGDVIYARLTDGVNSTSPATCNIVDSNKPHVTLNLTGAISEITATANAQDFESGIANNVTYKFSIKKASEPDSSYVVKQNTTSNICNITGLIQETNYVVKVEVEDIAGNIGIGAQSIVTDTMPSATGTIMFGNAEWNSGKAKVEISTNSSYYIEYQVNGTTGTWTKASTAGTSITAINLNHNDIVYARLTDGSNAGDYASITIADTIKPESFTITVSNITATELTIKGSTIDNQSGLASYTYVVEDETGTKVKEVTNQTATTYKVTGLTVNTTYVVYMIAIDNAGNTTISNKETIKTTMYKWEQYSIENTYSNFRWVFRGFQDGIPYNWASYGVDKYATKPSEFIGSTNYFPYKLNSLSEYKVGMCLAPNAANNGWYIKITKISGGTIYGNQYVAEYDTIKGKGNYIQEIESLNINEYPDDGEQNGYWYVKK